jgi:3',5'-cyclic AMP phosphodiesterase CpdA
MRRVLIAALLLAALPLATPAQQLQLPNKEGSTKFAVIGDTGTGDKHQLEVAKQLTTWRTRFPFELVVMMGDNLYGGDKPKDYAKEFEIPYKTLLDAGVKFYASLGNHDNANQRLYKPFNMNGEKYYTFKPRDGVRFFALDSNYVDDKQLAWLEKELSASGSDWKIMFFHHPLYSDGETHGSADLQRERLEPVFLKHGVNVVLSGHEHFYQRIKPQKGIAYFILGNSAKLRKGDVTPTALNAKAWDSGYGFMLMEVIGDDLFFQVISDKGQTVDAGSVHRVAKAETKPVIKAPGTPPTQTTQPVEPGKAAPKQPVPVKPATGK